jgi:hypothetical protein
MMLESNMKATRQEVYATIDSRGPVETEGRHYIAEFCIFMEDYLAEAKHALSQQ